MKVLRVLYVLFICSTLFSCQNNDDIYDKIDEIKTEITDMRDAINTLQAAHAKALYIKEIKSTDVGYNLIFSDETCFAIMNPIVQAVTQDKDTGIVCILLTDGTEYLFNNHIVNPSSIAILTTRDVLIDDCEVDSIDFFVNPSNSMFVYDGSDNRSQIRLRTIDDEDDPGDAYILEGVKPVFNKKGEMQVGMYRAYIKDCDKHKEYSSTAALSLTYLNQQGDKVEVLSDAFNIKGLSGYGSYQWNVVNEFIDNTKSKQWHLQSYGDRLYSFGEFGIRAYNCSDQGAIVLVNENAAPSNNSKWARGVSLYNERLYVTTRQASGGRNELYVPQYRFRFEDDIRDYKKDFGEFKECVYTSHVTIDGQGTPDKNFGLHSLHVSTENKGNDEECAILMMPIVQTSSIYGSLWLNITSISESLISIPLLQQVDKDELSIIITPEGENKISIRLSNTTMVYDKFTQNLNDWFCLKYYTNNNTTNLFYRTRELGAWHQIDQGGGTDQFNKLSVGIRTTGAADVLIDDYYCDYANLDEKSYVNGSLEILNPVTLEVINKYESDIKFVSSKCLGNYLFVTGLWGFNVYDLTNIDNPRLVFTHRDSSYTEYQNLDFFEINGIQYVVFANYSTGISIWNVSNPCAPRIVKRLKHSGKVVDGYELKSNMYTFDVVAKYPCIYSTFAVKGDDKGTTNDARGIITYDVTNLDNIKLSLSPIAKEDWNIRSTDDDPPTVIRRYGKYLFLNFADKGVAQYEINSYGYPEYKYMHPVASTVKAITISDKGDVFVGCSANKSIYYLKKQRIK